MKYLLIFVGAIVILYIVFHITDEDHRCKNYSPDKQYSAYAKSYWWEKYIIRMPGQGGDQSGRIYIYDEVKKKVLHSSDVPMVSFAGDVRWMDDEAYIPADYAWKLPRKVRPVEVYEQVRQTKDSVIFEKLTAEGWVSSKKVQIFIDGCWRDVKQTDFNEIGEVVFESEILFKNGIFTDCDLTPNITKTSKYINKKLVYQSFEHRECLDCSPSFCGSLINYDTLGNITLKKEFGDCPF